MLYFWWFLCLVFVLSMDKQSIRMEYMIWFIGEWDSAWPLCHVQFKFLWSPGLFSSIKRMWDEVFLEINKWYLSWNCFFILQKWKVRKFTKSSKRPLKNAQFYHNTLSCKQANHNGLTIKAATSEYGGKIKWKITFCLNLCLTLHKQ